MIAAPATTVDPRTRLRAMPGADPTIRYEPFGAARDVFFCHDAEVVLDGPAGTGKSLACLKKLDRNAVKYPGSRQLIVRKTRTSLTQSALVTFEKQVIVPGGRVRFHTTQQAYLYPNGSIIVVGGLDKDSKVMSSEYDAIYVQEATELAESDWEALTTRLRNGVIPHQQLLGDCNPVAPTHWLNQRCLAGKTTRLLSRHEDNPSIWDRTLRAWTPRGVSYIAKLDALSGVRRERLRFGKWVATEGQVFDLWRREVHVVRRDRLAELGFGGARHVAGVDWGYTKPGAIGVWAIGSDDRMALVHEVYQTRRTQEWWTAKGRALMQAYDIGPFVCDPSEPAYIAAFREAGLDAVPARNDILPGITAVQERLTVAGDGRARLYVVEDALETTDPALLDAHLPTGFLDEIDAYVWAKDATGRKEKPVDDANHAMDPLRYVALYLDNSPAGWADVAAETDLGAFFGGR
ncbi:MAG: phage terminase large subunit [Thermomicrobiales bacterium]